MSPGYRTRTTGVYTSTQQARWQWANSADSAVVKGTWSTTYRSQTDGKVRQMTDYVTPGYKKASSEGQIINTWMWATTDERTLSGNGPRFQNDVPNGSGGYTNYWGDLQGPGWSNGRLTNPISKPGVALPSFDSLMDVTKTRCYANIDKPDFQSAVTLGEIKETISFLSNPFKTGLRLAETLNGKLRRAGVFDRGVKLDKRKLRNDLASGYLAFQYGLKPLVKEVVGILETLRIQLDQKPQRETARAKGELKSSQTWTAQESFSGINCTATYTYERTVTIRCGILYENLAATTTNSDIWGIRPKDIPLAIWQVSSLSFVVDWFVNVGDFISALTPSAGTRTLSMWTTTIIEEKTTRVCSNYILPISGWYTTRAGTNTETVKRVTYQRDPRTFAPSLAFRELDSLKNDASRLTSLIALFTTRIGTLKPYEPLPVNRFVSGTKVWNRWRGTGD